MSGTTRNLPHSLQAALALAASGIPVFPCKDAPGQKGVDKSPKVSGGFHAASTNEALVREWFADGTSLIGVPTGAAYDVLDIDPRNGGDRWLAEHEHRLPPTVWRITNSGGTHFLFKPHPGLRCTNGGIAPGVDLKAGGGYTIAWQAHGHDEFGDVMAEWPEWLLTDIVKRQVAATGEVKSLADRLPPSIDLVVWLLNTMPGSSAGTSREFYAKVMQAAAGCVKALAEVGTVDDDDRIKTAAVAWAERYESYQGDDEGAKWDDDWMPRATTGWHSLTQAAEKLGVQGAEFGPPEIEPDDAREAREAREAKARAERDAAEDAAEDTEYSAIDVDDPAPGSSVADDLSLDAWRDLETPRQTRYLGDLVTSASRLFLIGATGLGKTQLAHGMACGIASGHGFLHWACDRASRVLIVDGEMSTRLIKERLADAERRHGHPIPSGNLTMFAMDRAEDTAKRHPHLGKPGPLNKPAGQDFMVNLIKDLRPHVVIFDNLMSLVVGDQTTETPWSETQPLVMFLKRSGIAQVWMDHTGNDRSRQYGSSTKRWSVDSAGMLTEDGKPDPEGNRISFKLSFDAPHGKARERCKANWQDFATYSVTMEGDVWSSVRVTKDDFADAKAAAKGPGTPKPFAVAWHDALANLVRPDKETVTRDEWMAEGVRLNLTEAVEDGDTTKEREAKRGKFRAAVANLVETRWIKGDGDVFRDLTGSLKDLAHG
jgi:Bifunctional DNA primase/polymerase, N-terminal/AAA domain